MYIYMVLVFVAKFFGDVSRWSVFDTGSFMTLSISFPRNSLCGGRLFSCFTSLSSISFSRSFRSLFSMSICNVYTWFLEIALIIRLFRIIRLFSASNGKHISIMSKRTYIFTISCDVSNTNIWKSRFHAHGRSDLISDLRGLDNTRQQASSGNLW